MSEIEIRCSICRLAISNGRWLGTGVNGGFCEADAAANVTVSSDFDRRDLSAVVAERCETVGFDEVGPALLTAVDQRCARASKLGPVTVVATAGLSNPAKLPLDVPNSSTENTHCEGPQAGTVNLLVGIDRPLTESALASCLANAVEAKTATLQKSTGFTGTTSDALVVGCRPGGEKNAFVGSSTEIGAALRACVRDTVLASLDATYIDGDIPSSVGAADHGAITDHQTTVFKP